MGATAKASSLRGFGHFGHPRRIAVRPGQHASEYDLLGRGRRIEAELGLYTWALSWPARMYGRYSALFVGQDTDRNEPNTQNWTHARFHVSLLF